MSNLSSLVPLRPSQGVSNLGWNESAAGAFEVSLARNPDDITDWVGLAATLGELGREEDVKRAVATILRLHPDFSIKNYVRRLSYRDPAELTRFEDGLRKADLHDSAFIDM